MLQNCKHLAIKSLMHEKPLMVQIVHTHCILVQTKQNEVKDFPGEKMAFGTGWHTDILFYCCWLFLLLYHFTYISPPYGCLDLKRACVWTSLFWRIVCVCVCFLATNCIFKIGTVIANKNNLSIKK